MFVLRKNRRTTTERDICEFKINNEDIDLHLNTCDYYQKPSGGL